MRFTLPNQVAGDNRRGPLQFYDLDFPWFYFLVEPGLPADVSSLGRAVTPMATFGPGEANQTSLMSEGQDVFVARYRANGQLLWVKQAKGFGRGSAATCLLITDSRRRATGKVQGVPRSGWQRNSPQWRMTPVAQPYPRGWGMHGRRRPAGDKCASPFRPK
jgi:hypothetical protein